MLLAVLFETALNVTLAVNVFTVTLTVPLSDIVVQGCPGEGRLGGITASGFRASDRDRAGGSCAWRSVTLLRTSDYYRSGSRGALSGSDCEPACFQGRQPCTRIIGESFGDPVAERSLGGRTECAVLHFPRGGSRGDSRLKGCW